MLSARAVGQLWHGLFRLDRLGQSTCVMIGEIRGVAILLTNFKRDKWTSMLEEPDCEKWCRKFKEIESVKAKQHDWWQYRQVLACQA